MKTDSKKEQTEQCAIPDVRRSCFDCKHIADASWGNFVTLLQYKCDWYGKELLR